MAEKALQNCRKDCEKIVISLPIWLLLETTAIKLSDVTLKSIFHDWIRFDTKLDGEEITLWTSKPESTSLSSLLDQAYSHFFIQFSAECLTDEQPKKYQLKKSFSELPESFIKNCSLELRIFYIESGDQIDFPRKIASYVRGCIDKFCLENIMGMIIDVRKLNFILMDLADTFSPNEKSSHVIKFEVDLSLIGGEDSKYMSFFHVLQNSDSGIFTLIIQDNLIRIHLKNDIRFWIVAAFSEGALNIKCFSLDVSFAERRILIDAINQFFGNAAFRANQLSFLREMNDTRLAR